jgi:uncharacterized membrane protein (UPF0127 family)
MSEVLRPLAALLVFGALAAALPGCSRAESADAPAVTIRGQRVSVEVAKTRSEQALGLGDRDSLDWGRGMLFPYESPGFMTFWMRRMRFDIDIVWIRDRRIVGIEEFVPYPREQHEPPATVRAPELVDMVLEVPAGFARAHGWRRGDRIAVSGLAEGSATGN